MSLLAANLRRRAAQRPAVLIARRNLGENVRGPGATSLSFAANAGLAKAYFTHGAVSYAVYKQQLQSLRLFVFTGVTLGCVLGLALDPPKSSYWLVYSPSYWFSWVKESFSSSKEPLFLDAKVEREVDTTDIVNQLITTRRIVGSDTESE